MAAPLRPRITVVHPAGGRLLYWLPQLYAFSLLAALAIVFYGLVALYAYLSSQLPPLPDLRSYADEAPGVTTLLAQDGSIIAELSTERREIVPLGRVPQPLIDALIATE